MIRNMLALLGLAAIGLIAAIALQASGYLRHDDDDRPRVRVDYDGLDLTTPAGMRILERRINGAIRQVCGEADGTVGGLREERECRRDAIAGVEPQVDAAVARAYARRDDRPYDLPPPPRRPLPPPPPLYPYDDPQEPVFAAPREVVQPLPPRRERRPVRHVRRTVTTTVTTTRTVPAPRPVVVRPAVAYPAPPMPTPGYVRHNGVAHSWLPPAAWRAAERATLRAFVTGGLVRWVVPGREGYVTVSPTRWIKGRGCRNVTVVKYADQRQVVVASGTRCRLPDGGLTG